MLFPERLVPGSYKPALIKPGCSVQLFASAVRAQEVRRLDYASGSSQAGAPTEAWENKSYQLRRRNLKPIPREQNDHVVRAG